MMTCISVHTQHVKKSCINKTETRCITLEFSMKRLLVYEIDTETRVQVLDGAVCFSIRTNALLKGILYSPVIDKLSNTLASLS